MTYRNKRIYLHDTLLDPSLQAGGVSDSLYVVAATDMNEEVSKEEEARCDRDTLPVVGGQRATHAGDSTPSPDSELCNQEAICLGFGVEVTAALRSPIISLCIVGNPNLSLTVSLHLTSRCRESKPTTPP